LYRRSRCDSGRQLDMLPHLFWLLSTALPVRGPADTVFDGRLERGGLLRGRFPNARPQTRVDVSCARATRFPLDATWRNGFRCFLSVAELRQIARHKTCSVSPQALRHSLPQSRFRRRLARRKTLIPYRRFLRSRCKFRLGGKHAKKGTESSTPEKRFESRSRLHRPGFECLRARRNSSRRAAFHAVTESSMLFGKWVCAKSSHSTRESGMSLLVHRGDQVVLSSWKTGATDFWASNDEICGVKKSRRVCAVVGAATCGETTCFIGKRGRD